MVQLDVSNVPAQQSLIWKLSLTGKTMIRTVALFLFLTLAFVSCSSFIKDEQIERISVYERYTYELKSDLEVYGKAPLKKGTIVRLYLETSNDFVKVYVYPANESYLKSEHLLALYVFGDDFSDERFDETVFREMLDEKLIQKGEAAQTNENEEIAE